MVLPITGLPLVFLPAYLKVHYFVFPFTSPVCLGLYLELELVALLEVSVRQYLFARVATEIHFIVRLHNCFTAPGLRFYRRRCSVIPWLG